jgi:hypothetical protein
MFLETFQSPLYRRSERTSGSKESEMEFILGIEQRCSVLSGGDGKTEAYVSAPTAKRSSENAREIAGLKALHFIRD